MVARALRIVAARQVRVAKLGPARRVGDPHRSRPTLWLDPTDVFLHRDFHVASCEHGPALMSWPYASTI